MSDVEANFQNIRLCIMTQWTRKHFVMGWKRRTDATYAGRPLRAMPASLLSTPKISSNPRSKFLEVRNTLKYHNHSKVFVQSCFGCLACSGVLRSSYRYYTTYTYHNRPYLHVQRVGLTYMPTYNGLERIQQCENAFPIFN